MPLLPTPPGAEGILRLASLPDPEWRPRWDRIVVAPGIKDRLLNYAVFALTRRQGLDAVGLPVHGLAVLAGGLANRAAEELPGGGDLSYVEIDPHRFPSQLLGESQRGVARLFERTIPDLAARGRPTIVLLDEVETLAVSRSGASLETNPVDVHRATEAVLAGVDHVAANHRNVLFLATTNFIEGLDAAFLSRADLVEEIGLPGAEAAEAILRDAIAEVGAQRSQVGVVQHPNGAALADLARLCAGMDARGIRKLVLRAIIERRELALEPSALTPADLEAVLRR